MKHVNNKFAEIKLAILIISGITLSFGTIFRTQMEPVKNIAESDNDIVNPVEPNEDGFVWLERNLYYNSYTHIMHYRYATYGSNYVYIPVISPNGHPYGWNPKTEKMYMTGPNMDPKILIQFE